MTRILLTPREAAEALGISRSKVYQLMAAGQLASVRIGSARRISIHVIEAFIDDLARAQARIAG